MSRLKSVGSGLALCRIGNKWSAPAGYGFGVVAGGGAGTTTLAFNLDGLSTASVVLRDASDDALALEVSHRKFEDGTQVLLYAPAGHREWSMPWHFNSDATISPIDMTTKAVQDHLVLGLDTKTNPYVKTLCLVLRDSPHRFVCQLTEPMVAMAPRRPNEADAILSVASPPCEFVGLGRKAIGLVGHLYVLKKHNGRGQQLAVGHVDQVRRTLLVAADAGTESRPSTTVLS